MENKPNYFGDNRLKEMLPLIERNNEKKEFKNLSSHQSQLKNEELFFRMMAKGS